MFIDRIQRIFNATRFQALLLEVFAIFLGITASFAVDEWREERQARAEFERYLQAIYFDALREEALLRRFIYRGTQAVVAIDTLQRRGAEELTDAELLGLVSQVFRTWSLPRGDASYRALEASEISTPFDDTMQALNAGYELNSDARTQLEALMAEHNRIVSRARSQYGSVSNPQAAVRNEDRSISDATRFDQPFYRGVRPLFFRGGEFLPLAETVQRTREAAQQPDTRDLLTAELERVMQAIDLAIAQADTTYTIRRAIRQELPDLRLAVRSMSLVGDATPTGWAEVSGLPLRRERADGDWWSAEVELEAGSAKLVANGIWGTSWGAPIPWERVDPLRHDRDYLGDLDRVFPRGIAEFDGVNIPVEAGRYRVRFNTHTFEYAFEPIAD
jgi:hypothetical protein